VPHLSRVLSFFYIVLNFSFFCLLVGLFGKVTGASLLAMSDMQLDMLGVPPGADRKRLVKELDGLFGPG
jgi:hypothetical protein